MLTCGRYRSMYSEQAGSMHFTGKLSCLENYSVFRMNMLKCSFLEVP